MDLDELRRGLVPDLRRVATELEVPGASVAVVHDGRVLEAVHGVTNTRTGVEVTPDSVFQIQSITKVFTATLIMQLVDEGLAELDAPVRTHLPRFRTADPEASARITIRHLLTHTGGFEGDLWQPTTDDGDALRRFVSDLVPSATQHSAPGRHFSYCNAGFGVLGHLVEVLRGTTYEAALRQYLLDPLEIDEVAFSAEQALGFRTAIGHVRPTEAAPLRPTRRWSLTPPSNPAAGNQLAMSARNLLQLGRLFLANGRAPGGDKLLSSEACTQMLQPQLQHRSDIPSPTYQGFGWQLPRPAIAEHTGGMPGEAALLAIAAGHDLAAVVLTNAASGLTLARQLLDPIFTDLAQVPPTPQLPTPDATLRVPDPRPFVGRYFTRQTQFEVGQNSDGRLWLTQTARHEAAEMSVQAGYAPRPHRSEIRHHRASTFAIVDDTGRTTGTIAFLERNLEGQFRVLATDRLAIRSDI